LHLQNQREGDNNSQRRFFSLNEIANNDNQFYEGKIFKIIDSLENDPLKVNFKYVQVKVKIIN